ncbi:MAG TPA: hypothetical protein VGM05_04100 [Planctomycetaceae bacterium]|jgi:hypothetical protein
MVRALPAVVVLVLLSGCGGEPVREDRAADWSRGGDAVAFQHDTEGIYVAGKDGQGLARIFEPDASVLATSRPLYSPTDGRLIFTTAYDPEGQQRPATNLIPSLAEGNIVHQRPVKYICWLRDEPVDGNQPAPRELFQASCEHVGYIAAGLAVRWHPDGQRIVFVDSGRTGNHQHSLYEFDLRTWTTRSVFPQRADAVIFDFAPGGSHLVCVTGFAGDPHDGTQYRAEVAGIWTGSPDDDKSWWKAAGTERLAVGELPSLIEGLRASRPAWTDDDQRFASVVSDSATGKDQSARSLLRVTNVATRKTQTVHQIEGTFADLHWSRDGNKLGFIERQKAGTSSLRIYDRDGKISEPIESRSVRRFAGFDRTGSRLAYVVADETGLPAPDQEWNFILPSDRLARDTVAISETSDTISHQDVFSGMRVTFPIWSPQENRLSLWLTFSPRYRSLFSILFRWGLWPGDPAATLDLATGEIAWMAVSPAEELQIGHYYLLKRDYARAWERYEKANAKLPARRAPRDLMEFVNTIGAPERSQLFEYHCLQQLGRHDDARARLADFEQTFFPAPPAAGEPATQVLDDILRQFGPQAELLKHLLHDLYVAEVFLSIDAPEAGIAVLQEQTARSETDSQRLSGAVALAQVLLAAGRREAYLTVCSDQIIPLAWAIWKAEEAAAVGPGQSAPAHQGGNFVLPIVCGLSLLPLAWPEFLAGVPDASLREALAKWEASRPQISDDVPGLAIDLFLRAAHLTLGDGELASEYEARITASPIGQSALGTKTIDEALREIRASVRQTGTAR